MLPILKEISDDIHIKSFASQVTAVDVFSIHKAAIFSAEQLIVGIEASRGISGVERKIIFCIFVSDILEFDFNLPELNLSSVLSFLDTSNCV